MRRKLLIALLATIALCGSAHADVVFLLAAAGLAMPKKNPDPATVLLGILRCSKTMLLCIIAGLKTETPGKIWFGNRQFNGVPPRMWIGSLERP